MDRDRSGPSAKARNTAQRGAASAAQRFCRRLKPKYRPRVAGQEQMNGRKIPGWRPESTPNCDDPGAREPRPIPKLLDSSRGALLLERHPGVAAVALQQLTRFLAARVFFREP